MQWILWPKQKWKLISMCKVIKIPMFIFGILICSYLFSCTKINAEENKALVIYDTYNKFGQEENKLNSLVQLVLSNGKGVDIVSSDSYSEGSINKYKVLIVMYNNPAELPKGFAKDLLKFNGKVLWVGENFNERLETSKNITHISQFSSKDESYSVLDKAVYKIINGNEKKEEKKYLMIDKIYPFIDLNSFVAKVDFLHDQGISFICSVMPVYENQDFDAMKRFCEVLRYAQSKGGIIILHSSVLYGDNIKGKDVMDKMELAQQIYVSNGVYPLALDIPEGFLYKEDYRNLVSSSNNIFIEKDNNIGILDLKNYSINQFDRVIHIVGFEDENSYAMDNYSYAIGQSFNNTAISFNPDLGLDSFKEDVNKIISKGIYFNDAENLDTAMKLGGVELSSNINGIELNNKPVNTQDNNTKALPKAKDKNHAIDISGANSQIIKVTSIVCGIFVVVVMVSFKIDRKKFFNYKG